MLSLSYRYGGVVVGEGIGFSEGVGDVTKCLRLNSFICQLKESYRCIHTFNTVKLTLIHAFLFKSLTKLRLFFFLSACPFFLSFLLSFTRRKDANTQKFIYLIY